AVSPLPISSVQALAFDPRSSAVFAGTDQGVFRSTDGGATWSAVNAGLTTLYVQTLALDSAREILYAGTYGGSVFALALTVSPGRVPSHIVPPRWETFDQLLTVFRVVAIDEKIL